MTRGRCGLLTLQRMRLSLTPPCRFYRRTGIPINNATISPMASNDIASILQQLRDERDQLDEAINALSAMTETEIGAQTVRSPGRRGRTARRFSPESIAKMKAAQRARRAREGKVDPATNSGSRRRRISPEGLARVRAAQRARWVKARIGKAQ